MNISKSGLSGLLLIGAVVIAASASVACGADAPAPAKGKGGEQGPKGFGEVGTFTDFPEAFVEDGVADDVPKLFAKVSEKDGDAAAPCLLEPQAGTLYPKNWLAPRFAWTSSDSSNVIEIRVTAKNQTKDLVVYTTGSSWTMPKELWNAVREHSADVPMTVSIRGAFYSNGSLTDITQTAGGDLGIAPVEAPGSIVFWSIGQNEDDSLLKGFTVGEEGLVNVLRREEMPANGSNGRRCFGCHVSTPDGKSVAVTWEMGTGEDAYVNDLAQIEKGQKPGARPSFVTSAATTAMDTRSKSQLAAFSRSHWAPNDRLMVTNDGANLVWIDLEAKVPNAASGVISTSGDPSPKRLGPSWSRDGKSIAYMGGALRENPAELNGPVDLFMVPFGERSGGTARPIAGASDPSRSEGFPAFSPDDAWVAFNMLPDNSNLYDNPKAEIYVVPRDGGENTKPIRLSSNDPPSCSGKASPGITNSWPKWAPEVAEHNGKKYYFVVFSSRRHLGTDKPQLYVAPIVVDSSSGDITTYPAIYLRNQESITDWQSWGNHTPAWDVFSIEPAVVK